MCAVLGKPTIGRARRARVVNGAERWLIAFPRMRFASLLLLVSAAPFVSSSGCLEWCSGYTCGDPDCDGCTTDCEGFDDRAGRPVVHCATYCNVYTCTDDTCSDCGDDVGCYGRTKSPPSPPPFPRQPAGSPPLSEYYAYGSRLYTNAWGEGGEPTSLVIKGVSWFGMESQVCFIGGSHAASMESSAAWLKQQGFNAIRVPLAADAVVSSKNKQPHSCMINGGDREGIKANNPALLRLSYIEQLVHLAKVAADAGLLILLDMHVAAAGVWPDGGRLDVRGRELVRTAWKLIAERLCDPHVHWNVFAADLKNEPYAMYWGGSFDLDHRSKYDWHDRWDTFASELGQIVHSVCPRWLVFVQGVGHCRNDQSPCTLPAAPGHQDMTIATFWGENLQSAAAFPIDVGRILPGRSKVVYSPHTCAKAPNHFANPSSRLSPGPALHANGPSSWSLLNL